MKVDHRRLILALILMVAFVVGYVAWAIRTDHEINKHQRIDCLSLNQVRMNQVFVLDHLLELVQVNAARRTPSEVDLDKKEIADRIELVLANLRPC